jgi:purine-nucleoside/S-methyl-5'-thioadenosine phosphorylase / adenosine deaminase
MLVAPETRIPITRAENGVDLFAVPGWERFDWLWHGFSTHRGGVSRAYLPEGLKDARPELGQLNLGFTAADPAENVRENRLRWIEAVTGSRETPLRTIRQIHSGVSIVAEASAPETIPEADGIMTGQQGILLGVMTADCIPVLVADPIHRAVAAFHAGWRGTAARIVEHGVARMTAEFGSDPAQLVAAVGPGIGLCCYTVGGEVEAQFEAQFRYGPELFLKGNESSRLDLIEANRRQLLASGLSEDAVAVVGGCTSCRPWYFYSHRASGGHAGRMMASIGIRPA